MLIIFVKRFRVGKILALLLFYDWKVSNTFHMAVIQYLSIVFNVCLTLCAKMLRTRRTDWAQNVRVPVHAGSIRKGKYQVKHSVLGVSTAKYTIIAL